MNKYEPSSSLNTPSVLDKNACPFTSEETENLSGMVANRLALFEKNRTNFPDNPCGKTSIKQTTAQIPNRFILERFTVNRRDPDKENRSQYVEQGFRKKTSINKNVGSGEIKPLWSMSEETSKELNIPLSVKQAKLCFERSLEMPNLITGKRSENNMNVPKRTYRNEPAVLPENNTTHSLKGKLGQTNYTHTSNDLPDIVNLLSSSSTSSSISSANSTESAARPHKTDNYQTSQTIYKPVSETIMSVELKSQLKYKTNNIASKIKKLESKFSRCSEEQTPFQPSSIRSTTTLSNDSFKSNSSSSKSSYQSPKFLQLFQKQMDLNNSNKNSKNLRSEEADVSLNNASNRSELPQNIILDTNTLRKMTSSSSIGSSASSASSTNENEATDTITGVKVDNAPCVLPSILRGGRQKYTATEVTQKAFNKLENTPIVSAPDWMPANTAKPTTRSSYAHTGGFVKNNAAIFNRNSDPLGTQIGFKKAKTSACTAREALIRWCRNRTIDYDNVSIENFSSSWSNGLAFCAIMHHFMPHAFEYESLSADNARYNFELAFKTAEDKAGIVSLLDVDDMIEMGNSPDWKCVFTYVHSIYQRFKETA